MYFSALLSIKPKCSKTLASNRPLNRKNLLKVLSVALLFFFKELTRSSTWFYGKPCGLPNFVLYRCCSIFNVLARFHLLLQAFPFRVPLFSCLLSRDSFVILPHHQSFVNTYFYYLLVFMHFSFDKNKLLTNCCRMML